VTLDVGRFDPTIPAYPPTPLPPAVYIAISVVSVRFRKIRKIIFSSPSTRTMALGGSIALP
jgi:hypothetical protein